jgi:hypothetical protein
MKQLYTDCFLPGMGITFFIKHFTILRENDNKFNRQWLFFETFPDLEPRAKKFWVINT